MFNYLATFWIQVLQVFMKDYHAILTISYGRDYGNGTSTAFLPFNLTLSHVANYLAAFSLIGLSIFLFYQVYKLVHAFIGGFYEDAY